MSDAAAVRMSLYRRIAFLLDYEPTWFPELTSGLAILVWSICALLTKDYRVVGEDFVLPAIGLVFGPSRWVFLLRLSSAPRVAAAAGGAIWWASLLAALVHHYGLVPGAGPMVGMLLADLLTLARFSSRCAIEMWAEWQTQRAP